MCFNISYMLLFEIYEACRIIFGFMCYAKQTLKVRARVVTDKGDTQIYYGQEKTIP